MKRLIEEAFNHFGKSVLYEEQTFRYFMKKGMSRKEVENLVLDAMGMKIIVIGAESISREDNPMENFRLAGKEDQ